MSTPSRRRRRDAIETTAAIERAAADLVLEHGYEAVSVDMICEVAGVSQRTFFNHFSTKDAALLGAHPPAIDHDAAREFVSSTGPLLAEAARLVRVDPGFMTLAPEETARRIRAIGSSPHLMARQMEKVESVASELREIILQRLRAQYPAEDLADLRSQADLTTHLLAGLLRFIGQSWAEQAASGRPPAIDPAPIEALVSQVVSRLG